MPLVVTSSHALVRSKIVNFRGVTVDNAFDTKIKVRQISQR